MEIDLATLPPEIWAILSISLDLEDLSRLRGTGDKKLWARLCEPRSVTSVLVNPVISDPWALPAFLHEFRGLQSLEISPILKYRDVGFNSTIADIPSTVQNLDLSALPDEQAYAFLRPLETAATGQILQIPLLSLSATVNLDQLALWPSHLPSTLQRLSVTHWESTLRLPPGLQALSVISSFDSHVSVAQYPPNLLELSVRSIGQDGEQFISNLPPSLQSLSILSLGGTFSGKLISALPSGLLQLSAKYYAVDAFSISDWPRGLTRLELEDVPTQLWSELPRTLKILGLRKINLNEDEPNRVLPTQMLPPGLQSLLLDINDYAISVIDKTDWYFPQLTDLNIYGSHATKEAIEQLPPTLIKLVVGSLGPQSFSVLPRQLHSLLVSGMTIPIDSNDLAGLPRNLTSLEFYWSNRLIELSPETKTWTDRELDTTDRRAIASGTWTGTNLLPPYLTHLTIDGYDMLSNEFMLSLPRHITLLRASDATQLTDEGMTNLPPSLTVLELSSPKVTSSSFQHLPKTLTILRMESTQIFDKDISKLPQSIVELSLRAAEHLTNECASRLPRKLVYLDVRNNSHISASAWDDFPEGLTSQDAGRFRTFDNKTFRIELGEAIRKPQYPSGDEDDL
jgi:hypothetical protein